MNSILKDFHIMWKRLSNNNKKKFYVLIFFTIFLSIFEAASLSAIVPFLTAISIPEKILSNDLFMNILRPFGLLQQTQIATAATVFFIVVTIITGCLRFIVLKFQFSFSHQASNDVAIKIFENTINQEYALVSKINSSEIVSALTQKTTQLINSALMPLLQLMSSVLVFIVLTVGLLIIDWQLTLGLSCALIATYGFFIFFTRSKINLNSRTQSFEYDLLIRVIQETFGGIREIVLGNHKAAAKERFSKSVIALRASQASTLFLAACPKLFLEVVVFVSIAVVAYIAFFQSGSLAMSIPTLGAIAYAAQRLMPVIQQVYANILSIKGCKHLVQDLCKLLQNEPASISNDTISKNFLDFQNAISLKDVSFRYPDSSQQILNKINMEIRPGDRIGIFGKTGSGKSTLLDIIMGLLQPSEGDLLLDGKSRLKIQREAWYKVFSHVPQAIFLADTSVLKNITGVGNDTLIDKPRAIAASELAHVRDDIEGFSDGFDTVVGERGVRLSGGQLQRIGLARAFYDHSSILVLDEATSAIDPVVEERIENSLTAMGKDITIIKVAHRITTLKGCNRIYKVESGQIVQTGTYDDFFSSKSNS